jgi:hypothetical protein
VLPVADSFGTFEEQHRFYSLQLAPTLFGEWALLAERGRHWVLGQRYLKPRNWPSTLSTSASGAKPNEATGGLVDLFVLDKQDFTSP